MAGAPKHVVVAVLLALTLAFSPEHAREKSGRFALTALVTPGEAEKSASPKRAARRIA